MLHGLLGWFADLGVRRIDLRASPTGLPLYASAGFRLLGGASMAWTAVDVRPGLGFAAEHQEPAAP